MMIKQQEKDVAASEVLTDRTPQEYVRTDWDFPLRKYHDVYQVDKDFCSYTCSKCGKTFIAPLDWGDTMDCPLCNFQRRPSIAEFTFGPKKEGAPDLPVMTQERLDEIIESAKKYERGLRAKLPVYDDAMQ